MCVCVCVSVGVCVCVREIQLFQRLNFDIISCFYTCSVVEASSSWSSNPFNFSGLIDLNKV